MTLLEAKEFVIPKDAEMWLARVVKPGGHIIFCHLDDSEAFNDHEVLNGIYRCKGERYGTLFGQPSGDELPVLDFLTQT